MVNIIYMQLTYLYTSSSLYNQYVLQKNVIWLYLTGEKIFILKYFFTKLNNNINKNTISNLITTSGEVHWPIKYKNLEYVIV